MRGVRFEEETDAALVQFADENTAGNVAEALRLLVGQTLRSSGALGGLGRSLKVDGYNAGLRAGLSEARSAIAGALNKLWRV